MNNHNDVTKHGVFVTRLSYIAWGLLAVSVAHTVPNVLKYSGGINVFFFFTLTGVLSMEFLLYTIVEELKDSNAWGDMRKRSWTSGGVAFAFITLGIIGGHNGWAWVFDYALPLSAPVAFLLSAWIMSSDPAMIMRLKERHNAESLKFELKMETIQHKRRAIEARRIQSIVIETAFKNKAQAALNYVNGYLRWNENRKDGKQAAIAGTKLAQTMLLAGTKKAKDRIEKAAGISEPEDVTEIIIEPSGDGYEVAVTREAIKNARKGRGGEGE